MSGPSLSCLVALSGGVDSAVAAALLLDAGHDVECLHMSNWDDDDGYCTAAQDLQDARSVCRQLGVRLHRVSFAQEYRESVFREFLDESRAGRTPNPDVLCNREIKFGHMLRYARRLGADRLATGHYARLQQIDGQAVLLKGCDPGKDQSYFLHAVAAADFADVSFPLGDLTKAEVRSTAARLGLSVAEKRDSTGICFIGERRFDRFLQQFIAPRPGPIMTPDDQVIGEHQGLHFYTLGQRKGLGIGGLAEATESSPWYVAEKRSDTNTLVVVQGSDHPLLNSDWIRTSAVHWIGAAPREFVRRGSIELNVKTRYRQADQACTLTRTAEQPTIIFRQPQRAVTPGQYAVFYQADRCLGGARIEAAGRGQPEAGVAAEAC